MAHELTRPYPMAKAFRVVMHKALVFITPLCYTWNNLTNRGILRFTPCAEGTDLAY